LKSLLIIDCGHSRTKFHSYGSLTTSHICVQNTPFKWPKELELTDYTECLMMGTNEPMSIRWLSHIKQKNGPVPMVLGKDCRVPIIKNCGVGTGNDRMVHALGAKAMCEKEPVIVISAGTALVIDIVNEKGELEGGLIGMGWGTYQKNMLAINSNLKTSQQEVSYPGRETDEAVALGWQYGVKALVEKLGSPYPKIKILITGGDGAMMSTWWPGGQYVENLGLDELAKAFGYKS